MPRNNRSRNDEMTVYQSWYHLHAFTVYCGVTLGIALFMQNAYVRWDSDHAGAMWLWGRDAAVLGIWCVNGKCPWAVEVVMDAAASVATAIGAMYTIERWCRRGVIHPRCTAKGLLAAMTFSASCYASFASCQLGPHAIFDVPHHVSPLIVYIGLWLSCLALSEWMFAPIIRMASGRGRALGVEL